MYKSCECVKFDDVTLILEAVPIWSKTGSVLIDGGHYNSKQSTIFGQLAGVARLFAQFYGGTRKSHWDFWPALFEQPIKLNLIGENS